MIEQIVKRKCVLNTLLGSRTNPISPYILMINACPPEIIKNQIEEFSKLAEIIDDARKMNDN